MSDWVVQQIRTWVPTLIGAALTYLATLGVDVTSDQQAGLVVGLTAVVVGGYYSLASWAGKRWPWLQFLLGSTRQPTYGPSRKELKESGTSA